MQFLAVRVRVRSLVLLLREVAATFGKATSSFVEACFAAGSSDAPLLSAVPLIVVSQNFLNMSAWRMS